MRRHTMGGVQFYEPVSQPHFCAVCHETKRCAEYYDGQYIGHICADCLRAAATCSDEAKS